MRVLVSGSHGLIGSALVPALRHAGHEVVALVRGPAEGDQIRWDPAEGQLGASLSGIDAAVHLAGEGLAEKRWTPAQKRRIVDSRVKSTQLLAQRLAEADPTPSVMVSGSAIGLYGNRGDTLVDEDSDAGSGFLARLCQDWEAAAAPAEAAGIRVVAIRTGIVMSPAGGALKKLLPLFKLGLGGKFGSGQQYQSWISIDDEVGAIMHALSTATLSGPVNLTAPHPVTNAEFTRKLGSVLHRPSVVPVPGLALSLVLGHELAEEMLLGGQRVRPKRLEQSGYLFEYPELESALRQLLGRP